MMSIAGASRAQPWAANHGVARARRSESSPPSSVLSDIERLPPSAVGPVARMGDEIIGEQNGLRQVMELVNCVAPTSVPVLIFGETGVGKEVIAHAIHERSARTRSPMIKVNCGAIPPELLDSELFGHEKGSFTGAIATRKGWFERADGGTLFLDEVGELPPGAQVRLLRVLQDGLIERVGSERAVVTNVRVIAATHRDLCGMSDAGRFRRDLWYRLSVFPVRIPPLRERPGDLELLARHFSACAGLRLHGVPLTPTRQDLTLLNSHTWPGNVRELLAVIERASILGGGERLEVAAALQSIAEGASSVPPVGSVPEAVGGPLIRPLEAMVVEHIERALRATGGQIEGKRGAASLLGINPHTLRARMRKLGIHWAQFRNA